VSDEVVVFGLQSLREVGETPSFSQPEKLLMAQSSSTPLVSRIREEKRMVVMGKGLSAFKGAGDRSRPCSVIAEFQGAIARCEPLPGMGRTFVGHRVFFKGAVRTGDSSVESGEWTMGGGRP
jgi:hypothetical protein